MSNRMNPGDRHIITDMEDDRSEVELIVIEDRIMMFAQQDRKMSDPKREIARVDLGPEQARRIFNLLGVWLMSNSA